MRKQQWELFGKFDWAARWKKAGDYMEGMRLPWNYKLNKEVYPHVCNHRKRLEAKIIGLFGQTIDLPHGDPTRYKPG